MWTPNVKVRLGIVNSYGEQKGVDSLIISDMINLARSRRVGTCVLVTGDEDLRVGVQQVQDAGIRVPLVGIQPGRGNQSDLLVQEADQVHELGKEDLEVFLSIALDTEVPFTGHDHIDWAAESVRNTLSDKELASLPDKGGRIPSAIDKRLLATLATKRGTLDESTKRNVRKSFWRMVSELKSGSK